MNIFSKYTRKTLRLNRTRTIVTVIGIILSVATFTAVTEGAASGRNFLMAVAKEQTGSFHAYYSDMNETDLKELRQDKEITASTTLDTVGYADIGSTNEAKPYLYIAAAEDNYAELVAVHITQGRMPQTDAEILIPQHLYSDGGVKLTIGDTLTLDVGKRTLDGATLTQNNAYEEGEALTSTTQKSYTVVGFYERPDYLIEDYSAAGYTALTGGTGTGSYTVFFTVRHPGQIYSYLDASSRSEGWRTNSDLLSYNGATTNSYLSAVIVGMIAILMGLIMFGSVALIYNAFSISVSDRTKQFGLLKSIGATNRQILHTVLYEALLLCLIAIPIGLLVGCAGIGITLYLLRDAFAEILDSGTAVEMHFVFNAVALVTAAVIGLMTALISAWIPARRAVRLSAIDAIRQTKDVSIKRGQVKTSRLTSRLFGFEGMLASKNFKRNRKQSRATVVSMFLSVVLFISASSFCAYLTDAVGTAVDSGRYETGYSTQGQDSRDPDTLYKKLLSADNVTKGTYCSSWYETVTADNSLLTDEYKGASLGYFDESSDSQSLYAPICFVEDGTFRELLADNGLSEDEYFSESAPLALLYDHTTAAMYDDNGTRWLDYTTFRDGALPFDLTCVRTAGIEGYVVVNSYTDESGNRIYAYRDEKMAQDENSDPSEGWLYVPAVQVETVSTLTVGTKIKDCPYFVSDSLTLLYPYSLEKAVMGSGSDQIDYYFTSSDHRATFKGMHTLLLDAGKSTSDLYDAAAGMESNRALVTVINVFSYGFITLISLIAVANVFNTISTNISLRRREFAMLKSVGMTRRGFNRMMNFECLFYGFKGLFYGLPVSFGVTWLIYRAVGNGFDTAFYVPWYSVLIASASVFLVVFTTIVYSMGKIRKDNPIDALKNENL